MIKEIQNFLNKDDELFINNVVLGLNFPFYFNKHTVTVDDKNYFFNHQIILRKEMRNGNNLFNSDYSEQFMSIVERALKKIKIKAKEYFRMSLNLTYPNGVEKCPEHLDHKHKHNNLILYLNECDENACTYICKGKKIVEIKPVYNQGVLFGGYSHYMINPKKGIRLVLVTTFI